MTDISYYGSNDYRNYLAHHGIKGQRWGVRRKLRQASKYAIKENAYAQKEAKAVRKGNVVKQRQFGEKRKYYAQKKQKALSNVDIHRAKTVAMRNVEKYSNSVVKYEKKINKYKKRIDQNKQILNDIKIADYREDD